jgi:hypothetical protein
MNHLVCEKGTADPPVRPQVGANIYVGRNIGQIAGSLAYIYFFVRGEGGLMHFDASLYIGEIFLHRARERGKHHITTVARAVHLLPRARFDSEWRPLSDCDSSGRIHRHGGPFLGSCLRRRGAPRSLDP